MLDTRINETDAVPNLVIVLDRLPHWDSLGALASHFEFVRVHQKVVRKVAVVGDSPLLSIAPEIANFLVSAKVRRFPSAKLEDANLPFGDYVVCLLDKSAGKYVPIPPLSASEGPLREERADFTRLELGCIEADFEKVTTYL